MTSIASCAWNLSRNGIVIITIMIFYPNSFRKLAIAFWKLDVEDNYNR